jgi:hypothetical protein
MEAEANIDITLIWQEADAISRQKGLPPPKSAEATASPLLRINVHNADIAIGGASKQVIESSRRTSQRQRWFLWSKQRAARWTQTESVEGRNDQWNQDGNGKLLVQLPVIPGMNAVGMNTAESTRAADDGPGIPACISGPRLGRHTLPI